MPQMSPMMWIMFPLMLVIMMVMFFFTFSSECGMNVDEIYGKCGENLKKW